MSEATQPLPLTDEQRTVVDADINSRLLVVAGPGTGKTHVLTARIIALLEAHPLRAQRDLLVLSFSRSAVAEIRRRIRSHDSDAAYTRVATFDSYATGLIHDYGNAAGLEGTGFDDRIRIATELLKHNEDLAERLSGIRHVFIDEIQDLIGVRAEFVHALLTRVTGGFTLFGDPAQAIYDWQEDSRSQKRTVSFISRINKDKTLAISTVTLSQNHRNLGGNAAVAAVTGPQLRLTQPDTEALKERVEAIFRELPTFGSLSRVSSAWFSAAVSTAFLCRNNGQALLVSSHLTDEGMTHRLQRSATDRLVPSWLSNAVRGVNQDQIRVEELAVRIAADSVPDAEQAAKLVQRASRSGSQKFVDLPKLAHYMQIGLLPDELYDRTQHQLTVSTVHRAKGLEFDMVLLHEPQLPEFSEDEETESLLDELRVMYVALTRARKFIRSVQLPHKPYVRFHEPTGRWMQMQLKYPKLASAVEFRARDVQRDDPPGTGMNGSDPAAVQNYLTTKVKPGDGVMLRALPELITGSDDPLIYGIFHEDYLVGSTSAAFWGDLRKVLRAKTLLQAKIPHTIEGLTVDNVESVAGIASSGQRAGMGSSGIWTAVRLNGLGKLRNFEVL
jgi:hypothetical protein